MGFLFGKNTKSRVGKREVGSPPSKLSDQRISIGKTVNVKWEVDIECFAVTEAQIGIWIEGDGAPASTRDAGIDSGGAPKTQGQPCRFSGTP